MIVRITRAKVGHCQAPYNQRGPLGGRFGFDLLKPMSSMLSRSDLTEAATQVMNRSQRSVDDNAGRPGVLHVLHDRGGGTEHTCSNSWRRLAPRIGTISCAS